MKTRLCITAKELAWIIGKSERYCRDIIKAIKQYHNKSQHQLVTIDEVCTYLGLPIDEVRKRIL